jgi:hypothetical protein
MTPNQTFAGMIAHLPHHPSCPVDKPLGYVGQSSNASESICHRCEAQAIETRLRALVKQLKSSRAHTYASENADHYRGFDAGQLRAGEALEAILGPEQAGERTGR